MTNMQRMENDRATTDRRELTDSAMKDSRLRNDELTKERRHKADKTMDENRSRNDELTASRREIKDGNLDMASAIFIVVLVALIAGTFFILI